MNFNFFLSRQKLIFLGNTTLGDSEAVNGYVELNSWNYFSYTSNSDNNMIVSLTSSNGGDCDLYVRANSLPTRFKYGKKYFPEFFNVNLSQKIFLHRNFFFIENLFEFFFSTMETFFLWRICFKFFLPHFMENLSQFFLHHKNIFFL